MRRLLLVVLTVAVTVGLAGAPASAQTKTRKDKVGDAAASFDLRSAHVSNRDNAIVVKTRFTKVTKRRTAMNFFLTPRGTDFKQSYVVDSYPVSKGRYKTVLVKQSDTDFEILPCEGLRATWKKGKRGTARVVLPQSCLGADAGTMEIWPVGYDKREYGGGPPDARQAQRADKDIDSLDSFVTVKRG